MIAYTTVGTNDLKRAKEFYDSLFGEIGIKELWASDTFVGYGPINGSAHVWCLPAP